MSRNKRIKTNPRRVLALDIGTRSIVGVLLEKSDDILSVAAVESLEHETRSMYDGQIHDVEAVAAEIAAIKNRLERATGLPLKQVAVAAAGRALRTARGRAEASRMVSREITRNEVRALELEAVQVSQARLAQDEQAAQGYFCVGYSVVNYTLEEQTLQNLVGQTGGRIGVEVIATFLPRVVVDSLLTAVRRAGLEVTSLTLEPIAALAAAIPSSMRLLNLALVDIGAGTSDIAIVRKDRVVAYAMVPVGGDEITEALAEEYLLDFNTAEQIKRRLAEEDILTLTDVLENTITVSSAEVIDRIKPQIRELANGVAREILVANQGKPDAVICVGGGSLTPGLLRDLADALELPPNRVGLRTRETVTAVKGDHPALTGPQAVTPLGIGLNALAANPLPLVKVKLNGHEIPLWGLQEITVATALLASGVNLNNIFGRPGMGLTIEVNGVVKSFKGTMGGSPTIKVNGVDAALDTPLNEGDSIEFARGADGRDAQVMIKDLLDQPQGVIVVNGEPITVSPLVRVNGKVRPFDEPLPDRSSVEIEPGQLVSDLLAYSGVDSDSLTPRRYRYSLNGQGIAAEWEPCRVWIDGREAGLGSVAPFGSAVEFSVRNNPTLKDMLKIETANAFIELNVNGQTMRLPSKTVVVEMNGKTVSPDHPMEDGAQLMVRMQENTTIVSDLLTKITITPKPYGNLVIKVNGVDSGFTTPLKNGDQVEFYWDDSATAD